MSQRRPRSLSANDASSRRRSTRQSDFVSPRMSAADLSSGLIKAIRSSDDTWMNALLAAGASVNSRDEQGRPVLCLLLDVWGHPDACKALLERGAQPDLPTAGSNQTALHVAAKKGYQVCIGQLLSSGANPDLPDINGNTPLMYSCANGHNPTARTLIKAGASTGRTNLKGETGLHLAAKSGSLGCVKELLAANCSINVTDSRGQTPLLLAAQNNRVDVIQLLLLDPSCRINDHDPSTGRTPLHWAVLNNDHETLQKLIDHGANLDLRDADWNTAFLLGTSLRDWDSAQILVKAGCDVTVTDKSFNTALHLTSRDGHEELIPALYESGLNLDLKGSGGMTALMLGTFGGHQKVVDSLLELGANPNLLDRNRASALVYAMLSDAGQDLVNDIVRTLIQFNADLEEGANLIGISRCVSLPAVLMESDLEDRLYSPIEIAFLRQNAPLCVMLMKLGCDLEPLRQLTASKSKGKGKAKNTDLLQGLIQFSKRQRRKVPSLKELSRKPALKSIAQFTSLAHIGKLCLPETLVRFLRFEDLLDELIPRTKSGKMLSHETSRTETRLNSHHVSKNLVTPVNETARRTTELNGKQNESVRRDTKQDRNVIEPVRKASEQNRATANSSTIVVEPRRGRTTTNQDDNIYRRRLSRSPYHSRRSAAIETTKSSENKADQTIQNQKPRKLMSSLSQVNLRTPQSSSSQVNLRTRQSSSSQVNLRAPQSSSSQVNLRTPRSSSSQVNLRTPQSSSSQVNLRTPQSSTSQVNLRTPQSSTSQVNLRTRQSSSSQVNIRAPQSTATEINLRTPQSSSSSQVNLRTPRTLRQTSQPAKTPVTSVKSSSDCITPRASQLKEPGASSLPQRRTTAPSLRSCKSAGNLSSTRADRIQRTTPTVSKIVAQTPAQNGRDSRTQTINGRAKSTHLDRTKTKRQITESHL